jgi:hypothetical protein
MEIRVITGPRKTGKAGAGSKLILETKWKKSKLPIQQF